MDAELAYERTNMRCKQCGLWGKCNSIDLGPIEIERRYTFKYNCWV